jgi:hypothetical protein
MLLKESKLKEGRYPKDVFPAHMQKHASKSNLFSENVSIEWLTLQYECKSIRSADSLVAVLMFQ